LYTKARRRASDARIAREAHNASGEMRELLTADTASVSVVAFDRNETHRRQTISQEGTRWSA